MFIGMLLSWAPITCSKTSLAASTRVCKSSRVEAAKAVHVSRKQRQMEAMVFFIFMVLSTPPPSPARLVEGSKNHGAIRLQGKSIRRAPGKPGGPQQQAIPNQATAFTPERASRAGLPVPHFLLDVVGGRSRAGADGLFAVSEEKRGVPRHHGKHAAWELLSPDLRCFC
jgi:hypothetical protein